MLLFYFINLPCLRPFIMFFSLSLSLTQFTDSNIRKSSNLVCVPCGLWLAVPKGVPSCPGHNWLCRIQLCRGLLGSIRSSSLARAHLKCHEHRCVKQSLYLYIIYRQSANLNVLLSCKLNDMTVLRWNTSGPFYGLKLAQHAIYCLKSSKANSEVNRVNRLGTGIINIIIT